MSLAWREFERKWRALFRAELARAPELRAAVKRQRKSNARALPHLARNILLPLFWCAIFVAVTAKQGRLDVAAGAVALWAAGAAFRWGHHWFQQFYASEDLVVLNLLPLDDPQIFRCQLRRYLSAAAWLFWQMGLAYLALALISPEISPPVYQLLLAGALQAVLVMALALHLANWLHMLPLASIGGFLRLTAIVLAAAGAQWTEFARYASQASEWFLPAGWVNYALLRGAGDPSVYALLLPLGAIIYLARFSFQRLRSFYSLAGVEIVPARSAAPPEEDELEPGSAGPRPGQTEIADRILARRFLEGMNWQVSGPIEKAAARFFTARERVVTEFLVAGDPGWTGSLKLSCWIWVVACTVVLTLGQFGGTIVFFAAYLLASASLPLFGGDWRGMRQTATGGVFLPAYSVYPVTFNSIASVFLKVNLLRIAAASPLIVTFGVLAAYRLGEPPLAGALIGVKLLAVLVCVQPLLILLPISNTTNDSSRGRAAARLLVLAPVVILLAGAAVIVFLSGSALSFLAGCAVLLALALLVLVGYRRAYRMGKFDLLTERAAGRL